ncbi:hypothetical protein ZIOFF_037102 [Zingiber officinale]|uniref:EF-hand domain-containing protein n=2 Tax=Zingiber officinale TaxID=94328 RepID=A0A8J5GFE7_ZINOF|nr:hypothetical protein ZIOFF_037102 [Zingiber officinale]
MLSSFPHNCFIFRSTFRFGLEHGHSFVIALCRGYESPSLSASFRNLHMHAAPAVVLINFQSIASLLNLYINLKMSKLRVLDFQYNLDKGLKVFKSLSALRDSKVSDLFVRYEPNEVELRKVFDKISSRKDKIDEGDLERLVKMTHTCHLQSNEKKKVCEAEEEAKRMLWAADLNKDGVVDFGEFMEVNRKGGVRTSEIKSAFWMFDQDGDGRISAADIQKMMVRLGESCSLEDCKRMVRHVDKNQDGVVDMDEFMEMMTSTMKLM